MTTNNKEGVLLVISTLLFLVITLTGSFVVSGNILDLAYLIILLIFTIQYFRIKKQEKNK